VSICGKSVIFELPKKQKDHSSKEREQGSCRIITIESQKYSIPLIFQYRFTIPDRILKMPSFFCSVIANVLSGHLTVNQLGLITAYDMSPPNFFLPVRQLLTLKTGTNALPYVLDFESQKKSKKYVGKNDGLLYVFYR